MPSTPHLLLLLFASLVIKPNHLLMATFPLPSFSTFLALIFALSCAAIPPSSARQQLHSPLIPTSNIALRDRQPIEVARSAMSQMPFTPLPLNQADDKMLKTNIAHVTSKAVVVGEEDDTAGIIIRSSPARPMPTYKQTGAPTPLPEFPTLGPPIVWSFPATPLPALESPPPQDMPALPKTGSKHGGGRSPPCQGPVDGYHRRHRLRQPPSVPLVAAEPATPPGPLEAPESAPAPTAGGPLSPPYH